MLNDKGLTELKQGSQNYNYQGEKLDKGTHLIIAKYKPTYWTQKSDGKWEMNKTRQDYPDAKWCGRSSFLAKHILIKNDNGEFATKALGQGLEITPISLPSKIKVGEISRFRLSRDGAPVAGAEITGGYAGYVPDSDGEHGGDDEMRAFFNKTDKNGEFSFKPTKAGLWFLVAEIERKSDDEKCENDWTQSTITFNVKK